MDGIVVFTAIVSVFLVGLILIATFWCFSKPIQVQNGIRQLVEHMPKATTRSDVIKLLKDCGLEDNGMLYMGKCMFLGATVESWNLNYKLGGKNSNS